MHIFESKFSELLDLIPGIIHVNEISPGIPLVFLNSTALSFCGLTTDEFASYDKLKLNEHIVHPESGKSIIPLLMKFMHENDKSKILTFFQKLRPINSDQYSWFLTSTRIYEEQFLVSFSNSIATMTFDRERVEQFLEERVLANNYNEKFNTLTKQEKVILSLIGKGYDAKAIASKLGNTPKTVNNIRNNIKQKLEMSGKLPSMTELVQFARIFNI